MPFPDVTQNMIAQELAAEITARTNLAVVQGADVNGNPTLAVGAGTAGSQSAFIKLTPVASLQTDALGLAQRVYGPHIMQFVVETSSVANVALLTMANLLSMFGAGADWATKIEMYLSANGVAPAAAGITGTPALSFWTQLYTKQASST